MATLEGGSLVLWSWGWLVGCAGVRHVFRVAGGVAGPGKLAAIRRYSALYHLP